MRRSIIHWLAPALCTLFVVNMSAASASPGTGTVVLTGHASTKKQTTVVAALTSALRQAKWTLVDNSFSGDDIQRIQQCFQRQEQPWTCIDPIASPKNVTRLVWVELVHEKPGTLHLTARFAAAGETVSGLQEGYCPEPCSDSSLAQSASDLVNRLLAEVAAVKGTTFIEVISDPPGASVQIDGRQVGPAGQKFPVPEGRHRVLVQLSGHRDADTQVDVIEGETKRVPLKLEPLDSQIVGPVETSGPPRKLQFSMIGGGTALLVGGYLYSVYATEPPGPTEPREHEYVYSRNALIVSGLGGAVAIAGAVWLLATPERTSKPVVSLTRDSVHAGWSFTF